jgi:hypothetical protein
MMKFYVKPEIEALALETVDVIETSAKVAAEALKNNSDGKVKANVQVINEQIAEMSNDWQW